MALGTQTPPEQGIEVMKSRAGPSPSASLVLVEVLKLMEGPTPSASRVFIEVTKLMAGPSQGASLDE